MDYRHDEWGVDVTVAGSQKGLMLPPGLSFNAISAKALAASRIGQTAAQLLGLAGDAGGQCRPAISPTRRRTNLLYGLDAALDDADGGRAGQRVCPSRPPCRGHPPRRAGVGAGDPVRRSAALFVLADGGAAARGPFAPTRSGRSSWSGST